MKLFFDIETLPAGPQYDTVIEEMYKRYRRNRFGPSAQNYDEFHASTSFDGAFGRIFCIAYALDSEPAQAISHEDEKEVLKEFWRIAKGATLFIGHNIIDFDLPFIFQRSVVLGVEPTKDIVPRFGNQEIYDTYREWTRGSTNYRKGGLDRLAKAFGFESSKKDIDGSRVFDYYRAGKTKEIVDYCKRDVELTRKVYKKLTFSS